MWHIIARNVGHGARWGAVSGLLTAAFMFNAILWPEPLMATAGCSETCTSNANCTGDAECPECKLAGAGGKVCVVQT